MALDVPLPTSLLDVTETSPEVLDEGEVSLAVRPVALIEHVDAGGEHGKVVEGHRGGRVRVAGWVRTCCRPLDYHCQVEAFDELIRAGRELTGVEYKRSGTWHDLRVQLIRTVLGMSNTRDGGTIIVGILEHDGDFIPDGMSDDHLQGFPSQEEFQAAVNGFAEPPTCVISCSSLRKRRWLRMSSACERLGSRGPHSQPATLTQQRCKKSRGTTDGHRQREHD